MSFFPPGIIADIIAVNESAMPDTCLITRNIAGVVNGTPAKPNFQPVAPGAPVICRVSGQGGSPQVQEQIVALQLQGIQVYVLHVPVGTDLRRTDQVTVNGETFTVLGTTKASSYSTSLEALIKSVGVTT